MISASSARSNLALVLLAGSAAAEKALTLGLTSDPHSSNVIRAKLSNTGTEQLMVLNDPRSVLNKAPTDTFSFVLDDDAAAPSFTGMKLKYSPRFAATNGDDSTFTVLKPGESVEVEHDLSNSYAFATFESSYNVGAGKIFYYWDYLTQELGTIDAKVVSASAKIAARDLKPRSTRASTATNAKFSKCSAGQQAVVTKATQFADVFANISATSLLKNIQGGGPLYQTWFGAFATARYNNATTHYTNITKNPFGDYTYDCTPEDCPDKATFAYVYPNQFGTIYLCNAFWQTTLVGIDSQAGTLIHESTHFLAIAGTKDIVYGRKGALELAATFPQLALGNADNHEYFSEDLFTLSNGSSTGK
ncbi:extracellular protease [Moniliophthora roreri MCA 2997]|uniref:Extracellular protease n=2 Tax=Moniliophthora roreri TaxID=221103 RepID=V2WEF4_MONRO|nr:extracellular protease [Moniliophthora roreri MCA 2997]KAI3616024.1 extracellular protease [Moniliophthora roreri]